MKVETHCNVSLLIISLFITFCNVLLAFSVILLIGVPDEYLGGHGYHRYDLMSPDGTVDIHIEHNVRGRKTYTAVGTMMAVKFVHQKVQEGVVGAFSMEDVLMG